MGRAAETGAWSYFPNDPLLRDLRQQGRPKALVRLVARILDVIEMASGNAAARLDGASPAPGEGVAVVRTARGTLMHHVRIADELVADYAIVAPTEWNFHPDGAFAQDLRGLDEHDAGRLTQLAHIEALSLDPCVPFRIEVHHA
jgi:Ni,Fe-hydrogenase I large subunit